MQFIPVLLIICGIVAIVITVAAVSSHLERRRREKIEKWAAEADWRFDPAAIGIEPVLSELPLFSTGHSRKACNLVAKRSAHGADEFWIFDYEYTVGHGKHRRTHRQTIAAFPNIAANLPAFQLGPESFFHKIASSFGYQDIDFEAHPMFSKKFLLRGAEEQAIRALFSADLISRIEPLDNTSLEGDGAAIICFQAGKRRDPADFLAMFQEAQGIAETICAQPQRPSEPTRRPAEQTPPEPTVTASNAGFDDLPSTDENWNKPRMSRVSYRETPPASFDDWDA